MKLYEYYAILSGEHTTLPLAELKAILESENKPFIYNAGFDNVVLFKSAPGITKYIVSRAGMVREIGLHILTLTNDIKELRKKIKDINICDVVKGEFAIRFRRFKAHGKNIDEKEIIDIIAAKIIRECNAKVNLSNPKTVIRVIVTNGVLVLGLALGTIDTKTFYKRRPASRPFFRPGALSVELSRVFVNLSRPRRGRLYLDPFCGTGGFLIEALFMGYDVVGIDLNKDMIEGARINIEYYGFKNYELIHGDATSIPLIPHSIGAIGTDPPYGRSTSTMGRNIYNIIEDFLTNVVDILIPGGYIVFATPHYLDVTDVLRNVGLYLVEKHYMRVHGSLTRVLWVTRKP